CDENKGEYLDKCTGVTGKLLIWLAYLRSSISRQVADRLLDAAQGAAIEVAGCISHGLVRPAIFSIRAQLELLLAWIYFNDHAVEWQHFERTMRDFPTRADVLKYMRSQSDRFYDRLKLLHKTMKRKNEDPYSILSVHVHSISAVGAPSISDLSSIVQEKEICDQCVDLQKDVAEFLTDVLAAWYADHWHDFPEDIKSALSARMTVKELKE